MELREARRRRGWTQGKLAAEARVAPALYAYAETGRFLLSATQARRLARALGVAPEEVEELAAAVATDGDGNRLPVGQDQKAAVVNS